MNSELLNEFLEASREFSVGPNQPGAIATPNFTLHAIPAQTEDGQFTVYFTLIPRTPAGVDARLPITLKGDDGTTRMGILTSPRTLRFLNIEAQTWRLPSVGGTSESGNSESKYGFAAKPEKKKSGCRLCAEEKTSAAKEMPVKGIAIYNDMPLRWLLEHDKNGLELTITCPSNIAGTSAASHIKATLYYNNQAHIHYAPLKKSTYKPNKFEVKYRLGETLRVNDVVLLHLLLCTPEQK